jgi:Na+/H+ antiporter NhaC
MIYVGYFYNWDTYTLGKDLQSTGVIDAISNCDAGTSLAIGSTVTLFIVAVYYICMKALSFKEITESFTQGFKTMVPAILILTLATSLKNMTGLLDSDTYVQTLLVDAGALQKFLPAIIFLVACVLAFATGTSWGTFGILIPIVTAIFPAGADGSMPELLIIGISACLAGAVCGDHCSPISDTTIMASAGAQCNHVNHVATQLPYALTVAAVSFVCFIISGFIQNWLITLPIGIVLMVGTLFCIKLFTKEKN